MPYLISSDACFTNWQKRFTNDSKINRSVREVVWRRHQCEANKEESGWNNENDKRKRIIHVRDCYNCIGSNLLLEETYIWLFLSLPSSELSEYIEFIQEEIKDKWDKISDLNWQYGDLKFSLKIENSEIAIRITSRNTGFQELENKAWRVFEVGLRKKRKRGNPKHISESEIKNYLPFHMELGCGPSIEAGLPPLNHFHEIYSIVTPKKKFVFSLQDDIFLQRMVTNPDELYLDITQFIKKCVMAKPTNFYLTMKKLCDEEKLVTPVFSNNLDGLMRDVGVEEYPLFSFENIYPKLDFSAKTLVVIGSHADRRLVREQARTAGMQIIFVDPELYHGETYPVEDAQDEDLLIQSTADEFAIRLHELF